MNRAIRIVVKIAEVRDGEAFQSRWPAAKRDLFSNDSRAIWLQQGGVDREGARTRSRCKSNKVSSGRREKGQSVFASLTLQDFFQQASCSSSITQTTLSRQGENIRDQKLNVACNSNLRFAAVPGENGPPCRLLETSNRREPRTPFGLATFTTLNRFRAFSPSVRL